MATNDDGLAAVLYAPGELKAKAGAKGESVTLVTETKYPFEESVKIIVKQSAADEFPLYLRIPKWTEGAAVQVNGKAVEVRSNPDEPGAGASGGWRGYVRIVNDWKAGDEIDLRLPMQVRVRTWQQNKNSVSVDYGPLTFSLKIEEKYQAVQSDKNAISDSRWQPGADPRKWPSYEILPGSPWNYGLVLDTRDPGKSFEVVHKPWPADNQPFTNTQAPLELRCKGLLLPQWTLDEHSLVGELPQSPVGGKSNEPPVDLTLVPMGGARLRISAFPVVGR
jgi:hypothetical protein